MPAYAGPSTAARTGDVAGTLRLMAYLALSLALIVLDHRGGWLSQARKQASLLVQPLWMVAGWPGRIAESLYEDAGTLNSLTEENRRLRNESLVNRARMARMQTLVADNARLRGLLDAAQRGSLDVQLAPILDIDLDPTRQRLVLDAGSNDGVRVGQTVIDAGGLLGQIIDTSSMHATVLLLTDPDHAVPVAIARNGVRLIAFGRGRSDVLALASIPLSSDVKVGDVIVTSGLGGRFPPGFAVGTITALRPDDSRAFLLGDVKPAAQLDRGRDVLLLRSLPAMEAGLGTRDSRLGEGTGLGTRDDRPSAAEKRAGLGGEAGSAAQQTRAGQHPSPAVSPATVAPEALPTTQPLVPSPESRVPSPAARAPSPASRIPPPTEPRR